MSKQRAHFVRTLVLNSLRNTQTYGMLAEQLLTGLIRAGQDSFISRDEAVMEIDWLAQKGLLRVEGEGDSRRYTLAAKGVTFCNEGMPWSKLEVLE